MRALPDRLTRLLGVDLPILQAPMAGANGAAMVIAVSEAGGLGALPCALLTPAQIETELAIIRQRTSRPINLNFFCHTPPPPSDDREMAWKRRLAPYYREHGLDLDGAPPKSDRAPFSEAHLPLIERFRPEVVSFHFGTPDRALLARVKATGAKILSSATTVEEARWLEREGCDAIIAQGLEAGGHRGVFLDPDIATQVGLFALLPQIVDAVSVPVIAAGGIGDARGAAAAFVLGADAIQVGTAYLFTPEATITPLHRAALETASPEATALTNLFTGRPARGVLNRVMREVGPMRDDVPPFPLAGGALAPLKAKAEAAGKADFSSLWSGQSAALSRPMADGADSAALTRRLMDETLTLLNR